MSKFAGFSKVKLTRPQRSMFDLSHEKRLSTRMGRLTPCLIQEAVPGDSFSGSSEVLLRLAPLLAPIYDRILLFVHFFFVPNRLLWEDWETFITGGRLGVGIDPVEAPIPPYYELTSEPLAKITESSLSDYLGVPLLNEIDPTPGIYDECTIDAMPYAAYQLVYKEYYRDRNLSVVDDDAGWLGLIPLQSGTTSTMGMYGTDLMDLRTRSYLHDYFTSALPFTQRGEEVLMPLAGSGSVTYLDQSIIADTAGDPITVANDEVLGGNVLQDVSKLGIWRRLNVHGGSAIWDGAAQLQNIDEVHLDSSSVSINDFRTAYALQVWLERNAVAGSRYVESNLAHFGVRSQDSRLQRPEYIGGGRIPVKISEVVSTAYSEDGEATVPLANMAGHGITYGNTNRFRYFCPEHGFIIGIMSIMNAPSYHQGLPRMFKRKSFLDYPWPTFAKLGEQEVKKYEIYASAVNMLEDESGEEPLFGYQSRYADWKYVPSSNHGAFHSSMLFWTLTRSFSASPTLSEEFVQFDDATQDRIFAVNGDEDNFWCYIHNNIRVRRCLPYFGTPNTLGFV